MDTSRISFGEMVAGVSGLVLFVAMFLPWYQVEVDARVLEASDTINAWDSFRVVDILLVLVLLVAVGMAVVRAAGAMPAQLPFPPGGVVAAAGALAILLILFRIVSLPGPDIEVEEIDIDRQIGIFLALLAAIGITFGGYTAMNERVSGRDRASGDAYPARSLPRSRCGPNPVAQATRLGQRHDAARPERHAAGGTRTHKPSRTTVFETVLFTDFSTAAGGGF